MSELVTDRFWEDLADGYWGEYLAFCEGSDTTPNYSDFQVYCEDRGLVPEYQDD